MRGSTLVERLRAPAVPGPDGVDLADWDGALVVAGYWGDFQPVRSVEDVVAQQRTKSTHWANLPGGVDVLETDRLRVAGVVYEVDGEPMRWPDGRGRAHHVEVYCYRIQGG